MLQKLLNKIEKSYDLLLKLSIKNNQKDFILVFAVPKLPIKGNEKQIDEFQKKLYDLSKKTQISIKTTQTSKGTMIESVYFESINSYLDYLGNKKHYISFQNTLESIYETSLGSFLKMSNFDDFLEKNYQIITQYSIKDWQDILKVVDYFLLNKNSNMFLRELPVLVHSKFIENHKKIIEQIIDFLALENGIEYIGNTFEEKFFIKTKPEFLRFRFLDISLKGDLFDDIYLKIEDFNSFQNNNIKKVFIVENEINYLTFPFVKDAIIIWGAGFSVLRLKNIDFLKEKEIYYFGDLDVHGFKILSNFRKMYSQTKSIFMDKNTFEKYREFCLNGKTISLQEFNNLLEYLTNDEKELFEYIYKNDLRLEQENIDQDYILKFIF